MNGNKAKTIQFFNLAEEARREKLILGVERNTLKRDRIETLLRPQVRALLAVYGHLS